MIGVFSAILGLVSLCAGVIYFLGNKLLDRYYATHDKLERARQKNVDLAIESLKDVVNDHKKNLAEFQRELRILKQAIVNVEGRITSLSKDVSIVTDKVTHYIEETRRRLERLESGTWVKAGDNTYILSHKKGG